VIYINKKQTNTIVLAVVALIVVVGAAYYYPSGSSEITITDDLGRVVTLEKTPERIISIAPTNTEILFALGLGDKVVGVTDYCSYPEAAQDVEKIGSFSTINMEKIASLNPDLILATGGSQSELVENLVNLGFTVVVIDPKNIDEILEDITLVGKITGKEKEAKDLTEGMEEKIKTVTDKTAIIPEDQKPSVFYVVWNDPLMTAGPDTFINSLIELAGGINIASDAETSWAVYAVELLIEKNPDVIIVSQHSGITEEELKTSDIFATINAVLNSRIYTIDSDIVSRAGPRIVDALEQFYEFLYPV